MEKGILGNFSLKTLKSILIGIGAALVAILALSGIASLIVYLSPMLDSNLMIFAIIIEAIAIFAGAYIAAHLHGSRGLIMGLICAIGIYCLLLLIGTNAISPLLKLAYCAICGMAGGFFGIK